MTGLGNVNPTEGTRVSLELRDASVNHATYTVSVRWVDAGSGTPMNADGIANVAIDPVDVTLEGIDAVPEATNHFVRTLLRTMARGVRDGRWPRRITRWRDEA
jgi:hypothetical protein